MNPIDEELRGLPAVAPSDEVDARVRRRARAELAASAESTWLSSLARAFPRVALPAAITVTVVGYLHWAFVAVNALHQ
jgi:hypothetical protein